MKLRLEKNFASDRPVSEQDTREIKRVLNRLGYYTPPKTAGMTDVPDRAVFTALKSFQKDSGQREDVVKPGDATESALNEAMDAQEKAGDSYIWRTMRDKHVRSSHAAREGQIFAWADPPEGGHPGEAYGCRCWAELVKNKEIYDPPLKRVYPELWLLPILGLGRLGIFWKIWDSGQKWEWSFGKYKSQTRWENQLKDRNWSPEEITEAIKNGKQYPAPNKVNPGNRAIRYEYKDRFVTRDEVTKEILQISKPGKFYPNK